jgi:hypothetical protein
MAQQRVDCYLRLFAIAYGAVTTLGDPASGDAHEHATVATPLEEH